MDSIDRIANKARKSISNFCINECKSYCCRKGYLILTEKQKQKVVGSKEEQYKDQIKQIDKNKFSLFMGKSDKSCPSLNKDFKCNIYNSKLRPKACHDFPLFINKRDKKALFSPRCLAVHMGLLYKFSKQLQLKGYKITEINSMVGMTGLELPSNFVDEKIEKERSTQKIYKSQS